MEPCSLVRVVRAVLNGAPENGAKCKPRVLASPIIKTVWFGGVMG